MTAHSELIESPLAYKLTGFILTNAEQNVIVRLLRSDPAIDPMSIGLGVYLAPVG